MTSMSEDWRAELIVEAESSRRWRSADDLVEALNRDGHFRVEARKPMGLPGWEWIAPAVEVVAVYVGATAARRGLDVATDKIVDRIVDSAVSWARSALQSERRGWLARLTFGVRVRPKRVVVYGPDGDVLRSVLVRKPDSDPEVSVG